MSASLAERLEKAIDRLNDLQIDLHDEGNENAAEIVAEPLLSLNGIELEGPNEV